MSSEKTEQPTHKKMQDARQKGQVIKSIEITSGFQLIVVFVYFYIAGQSLVQECVEIVRLTVSQLNQPLNIAFSNIGSGIKEVFMGVIYKLGTGLILVTVLSNFVQIGPVLASKAVGFKGERLNIVNNFKNLFSLKTLFELFKSSIKIVTVFLVFYYIVIHNVNKFTSTVICQEKCTIEVFAQFMQYLLSALIACYVVFGLLDYGYQYMHTMKQLRMTKEEVKQEYKNMEGDPHIKGKRRELQREIQSGSLAANVRNSSAIVRNPTHIAVCIYYHPKNSPIPVVIEKGQGFKARTIVKIAEQQNIPIVEDVNLARNLNKIPVNNPIPTELYKEVSILLHVIFKSDIN